MEWSPAHAKLHILLRQKNLLPKASRILMAVSGGQDSLCLARLLIDLQPKWQWALGLVHCDHQWRKDSAENADHVLSLATQWGIPAWKEVADTPLASEAAARDWRYERFEKVAGAEGYSCMVTGHTMSDRAETVLYNLIRGTGTDGLGTLPWSRPLSEPQQNRRSITLIRPLLSFTRQETADFCAQYKLPIWEDSSNQDLSFRRNRVRQELMPYLRSHFNPKVETALSQLAEITTADTTYLQQQTETLYQQVISRDKATNTWKIERQLLKAAPLSLQRRVIRQLLRQTLPQPPNFLQIEKFIALIFAPNGSQTDPYPGGWVAKVEAPLICWVRS